MNDLRFALRSLGKTPGFTIVVVFTLALGIGANTAIFSFFRGILLRPLPIEDPERVVLVKKDAQDFADPMGIDAGLLAADFRELRPEVRSLQDVATYTLDSATLTGLASPDLVVTAVVTDNFFSLLGTPAALGRIFTPADAGANAGRLATLSYNFWLSRFGGEAAIVGQTVRLNHLPVTIVGVMPPDFDFPREARCWVNTAGDVPENQLGLPPSDFNGRGHYLRTVLGRLQADVSRAQAEEEYAAVVARLPNPNQVKRATHLVTMRDQLVGEVRPLLGMLLGCVGLVLLVACLNVANLMLSRAMARRQEIGIRAALGATRWRIARQLLGESLVLALLGGAAGLMLGGWSLHLLVELAPDSIPRLATVRLDAPVLVFALGLSIVTGLICGLSPILGAGRYDLTSATKSADRGGRAAMPRRIRSAVVAGEVAVSLVLLVAAGLLLRSLGQVQAFTWGFDPSQVVSARVAFVGDRYADSDAQRTFYRTLLNRLEGTPGFESVATKFYRIGESWVKVPFAPEGHNYASQADRPVATFHPISPGYFQTLGITLLQGRDFQPHDDHESPNVAIIDATLAHKFFPAGNAVGQRLELPGMTESTWLEIVGVAASVPSDGPLGPVRPEFYRPFLQTPWNNFYVHVRTSLDVATAGARIRQAVEAIDAGVPVTDLASMERVIAKPADARRFPLGLLGAFAALALSLAAVGIYAVNAYTVAQRTREIGVRMALGAPPHAVVRLVLLQGLRPIAAGLLAGMAGAGITALAMRHLLFGVAPLDVPTFVVVPLLLGGVALCACLLPARRATKVDPMVALRSE